MARLQNIMIGFHESLEVKHNADIATLAATRSTPKYNFTFHNHFHPFVDQIIEQLNTKSIDGLFAPEFHDKEELDQAFFKSQYEPVENQNINIEYFNKNIDYQNDSAYAVYNWELFFHIPLLIAVHLSKNQRFSEAQKWFHYIFDPTVNDGKYWRFKHFRDQRSLKQIDDLFLLMNTSDSELDVTEKKEKDDLVNSYEQLRINPFKPHLVARNRVIAYMFNVVMKYTDNLIDWGDSLFRQDTMESLGEATQLYVMAANILGEKPQVVPQKGYIKTRTFAQIRSELNELGNPLVELEGMFPFNLYYPSADTTESAASSPLFGFGHTLYFCLPHNEKLLGYWDTVADRLFKIRHCMNIEGVVRQLPLFQPPIDPGMLVKAAASGIDISGLISGLYQPVAPVRSLFLIQKAQELCNEVKGLGSGLLSACEKEDSEALGLLRQQHEINIQKLSQDIRFLQWKEAESSTESLLKSRKSAFERYSYYQRLLGKSEEEYSEFSDIDLERIKLTEENFDEVYDELVRKHEMEISSEDFPSMNIIEVGKFHLNANEDLDINKHMAVARQKQDDATGKDEIYGYLGMLPNLGVDFAFWGMGGHLQFGGPALSQVGRILAGKDRAEADKESYKGNRVSKLSNFERRSYDWILQSNLAIQELILNGRQIITSLIREQITCHEYQSVKKRIEQSEQTLEFMNEKFTSEKLYTWMRGELSKLYFEYYKFAFDIAKKAEQTMKHELMRPELDETTFIKFNYWDGGRKGLLSGEGLQFDLKRMEMAYHDHNKREYEITKHISLRQLNPLSLLSLKATGECEVTIPEWLCDMDAPGHYMRRLKNVSVSIPCVTGPYTSVNCTLTLLKSSIRKSPDLPDEQYARKPAGEDIRFIDYYSSIQSVVTSSAQNDSGLFETNLRDERFLPFEGHGVISTWRLELPEEYRQFDYKTISDVILHFRFTSRSGGESFSKKSSDYLTEVLNARDKSELVALIDLKQDFPNEWHKFKETPDNNAFEAKLKLEHFPYLVQLQGIELTSSEVLKIENAKLTTSTTELSGSLSSSETEFPFSIQSDDSELTKSDSAENFLVLKYKLLN